MRLTAELINNSLSYINPLKERELDLRGHKIPVIENLGVAKEQDAIDFTDNDIASLSNLPLSPRLKSLYLSRNRVATIQATLARSVPNLQVLVLSHNQLTELADLDPLADLSKLTHLTLIDNAVTRKENYRLWVIWRCPGVRFLDFAKVKDKERESAKALFGTREEPTELANKIMSQKSNQSHVFNASTAPATNGTAGTGFKTQMTDKERSRMQELIRNAKSLEDIVKLEKALAEGKILVSDDSMDTS